MERLSLVIFDMDGLMFDTERLAIWAWKKAGEDFGYKITCDMIVEVTGLDARNVELYFKRRFGDSFPFFEIRRRELEYFSEHIKKNGVPVKEGLYDLLNFLKENSILKAVATSTYRKWAEECLSLAKVKDLFDLIVCGNDVDKGKPEPDIFLKVAKELNCLPGECIVLEDSENGLRAASRAKMRAICVPDLKMPSKEVQNLIYKQFNSLIEVKIFLEEQLKNSRTH